RGGSVFEGFVQSDGPPSRPDTSTLVPAPTQPEIPMNSSQISRQGDGLLTLLRQTFDALSAPHTSRRVLPREKEDGRSPGALALRARHAGVGPFRARAFGARQDALARRAARSARTLQAPNAQHPL